MCPAVLVSFVAFTLHHRVEVLRLSPHIYTLVFNSTLQALAEPQQLDNSGFPVYLLALPVC